MHQLKEATGSIKSGKEKPNYGSTEQADKPESLKQETSAADVASTNKQAEEIASRKTEPKEEVAAASKPEDAKGEETKPPEEPRVAGGSKSGKEDDKAPPVESEVKKADQRESQSPKLGESAPAYTQRNPK